MKSFGFTVLAALAIGTMVSLGWLIAYFTIPAMDFPIGAIIGSYIGALIPGLWRFLRETRRASLFRAENSELAKDTPGVG